MQYVREIPVRFADVDPAGIVYYPVFFHYYHSAFEDFFGDAHGTPYPRWIAERRIGFPTVHVEADFARPLRYGDALRVVVTVPRLSRRSVDFRFEAQVDGQTAAWSVVTKACIDMDSFEPRSIPDDLRDTLSRYEGSP